MVDNMRRLALPPLYYTTAQAAEFLGLSVRAVRYLVQRGELKSWKPPGGGRRLEYASLQQWICEHQQQEKRSQVGLSLLANAKRPSFARRPQAQRVLLVEDSIHFQKSIRVLFERHFPKVELYIADDGISGLVMLGALVPDVLILDLMLPDVHGIDGQKLIRAFCSYPIFQPIKLIVTTAMSSAELKSHHILLRNLSVVQKKDLTSRLPEELRSKCFMSYETAT